MKDYCTQNNGDCPTCSLVNYGMDCRNNPLRRRKVPYYYHNGKEKPFTRCQRIAAQNATPTMR